uniref:Putative ovule protein n=1 Tax=Solanum chacoense TaxID=4108 RepID=A0A0V0IR76_SOLCH
MCTSRFHLFDPDRLIFPLVTSSCHLSVDLSILEPVEALIEFTLFFSTPASLGALLEMKLNFLTYANELQL